MLLKKSDEQLISKALGGHQKCWVQLVKRYEGLVYNYCHRMTLNREDAMDLMQEVFIAAFRNLPAYRGSGQFKAWLMRIASNKSIDFLRSRQRNPLHQAECWEAQPLESGHNPAELMHTHSQNRHIQNILAELPAEQRLIVELKFFQHMTFEEIGQCTGISVNTIKTRLYTALNKLRGRMEVKHAL